MARHLYTLLFILVLPAILLRLWWRGKEAPDYRKRWLERFGINNLEGKGVIWFHTVSVGETIAATPLIKACIARFPEHSILITCMTPTGSEQIKKTFQDSVLHCYLPYDLPWFYTAMMTRLSPQLLVVLETEIWPNLIRQCQRHQIPVLLANARLSEKSAKGYGRVPGFSRSVMNGFSKILVQAQADGERFKMLGVEDESIEVTGSIKFDIEIDPKQFDANHQLKAEWSRPVWIAASTHEGEDELVLDAFKRVKEQFQNALLIIVPRHPERFDSVAHKVAEANWRCIRRSEQISAAKEIVSQIDVLVGDTMGELMQMYALADIAFVGGTLVPNGGHNVLEPLALNVPVVVGPHVFNFQTICDELLAEQAMDQVKDERELAERVIHLLLDDELRQQRATHARSVLERNRGALQKVEQQIVESVSAAN